MTQSSKDIKSDPLQLRIPLSLKRQVDEMYAHYVRMHAGERSLPKQVDLWRWIFKEGAPIVQHKLTEAKTLKDLS